MKIAYFTPLPPIRSGISDFAEELIPFLRKEEEIDIYTENNKNDYDKCIFKINDYEKIKKQYDLCVFQIGNNYHVHKNIVNKFLGIGGVIELHDISLQHYVLEATKKNREKYLEVMEYCHGGIGKRYAELYNKGLVLPAYENHSLQFTVCKFLIDKAEGVIVHSDFAKQVIKGINYRCKVINIPLHVKYESDLKISAYKEARDKLNIEGNTFVVGSFGLVTKNKRIDKVIKALSYVKRSMPIKFRYYVVGKNLDGSLLEVIKECGMEKEVFLVGYADMDKFEHYINACDLCINLRFPTQGESSASLHRLLGAGKITLVSKVGVYEEYPDDLVPKISVENEREDLVESIIKVVRLKNRKQLEKKIFCFAQETFKLEKNARNYLKYFRSFINDDYSENGIDRFLDNYYKKCGKYDLKIIENLGITF